MPLSTPGFLPRPDWGRSNRIKIALCSLLAVQIADGIITALAVGSRVSQEWNPMVAVHAASAYFVIFKIAGALACAAALWLVQLRFPRMALVSANLVVAFYCAVLFWNATILIRA